MLAEVMPEKWLNLMQKLVPSIIDKRVFIFDKDGTLTTTVSDKICPNDPKDILVLPDVYQCLGGLRYAGAKLAVVTNQGGVAYGIFNEMQAWDVLLTTARKVGGLDTIKVNFYHERGCLKRFYKDKAKPKPDMLYEVLKELDVPMDAAVFIGGGFTDEATAHSCGMSFVWAHDFFMWPASNIEQNRFGYSLRVPEAYIAAYKAVG